MRKNAFPAGKYIASLKFIYLQIDNDIVWVGQIEIFINVGVAREGRAFSCNLHKF